MKLSLLVLTTGKQEGKMLEIKLPQFLIGRDEQCHLRPASPLISKRHCALIQKDGKAYIRDFGSTNGTFVNNEPVKGERELQAGDELKVGPIQFSVRLETEEAKTPAPPTKAVATNKKETSNNTPAPPSKPATPAPATKAAVTEGEDDMALEMLMSLDEGPDGSASAGIVPEGSTIHEMQIPAVVAQGQKPDAKAGGKGGKPAPSGDTRSAAADILSKMTKRQRS